MPPEGGLRRNAIGLALAGGVEYGLQLAMPIILVRCLDETAFGQYRLLWLMAATALAVAPAFMPQSLFYFLSRAGQGQRSVLIGNVLLYLVAAGILAGVVAGGRNPWLQDAARDLFFQTHGISALFLALWVVASLLDVLPTADGNARWQAKAIIGLALLRTVLLALAALAASDIAWMAFAMLLVAAAKLLLLFRYIRIDTDGDKIGWQFGMLKKQLMYALPFAVGNALFLLRIQADQWVVVSMLSPAMYATFSIAAVVLPVASLIRQPVNNAMMPRLNSAYAGGDVAEVARLIARSNGAAALLLIPVVGGLFAAAPELVHIVYTSRYQQTAPIMQVYLIGMTMNAFAVGHVLSALGKGRFAAVNSAVCLTLSVLLSVLGILQWGLIGAAIGSVLTLVIGELWALRVVSRTLGVDVHRLVAWDALWPTALATGIGLAGAAVLSYLLAQCGTPSGIASMCAWPVAANAFSMLLAKGAVYLALFVPAFMLAGGRRQLELLLGWHRKPIKTVEGDVHEAA